MQGVVPTKATRRQQKCHCGHTQKTPDEVRFLANSSGSETTKFSQDCSQEYIVPSTTASLICHQSGIDLEKYQIKYSNKKNLEEERKAAQEFIVGDDHQGKGLTAADQLLFNV